MRTVCVVLFVLGSLSPAIAAGDTVDIAVESILWPRGEVEAYYPCYPRVLVSNAGTVSSGFKAWLAIYDTIGVLNYFDSLSCEMLEPGRLDTVYFRPYTPHTRANSRDTWAVTCSVVAVGDTRPDNDVRAGWFLVGRPCI